MSSSARCEALTRRGRPCRNAALPHSDPPRCARHRAAASDDAPVATQPYLPGLSPHELDALEEDGQAPDLQRELQGVRQVLYQLIRLWHDAAQELPPEEARRLATLVFTGARTVAYLLNQQAGAGGEARGWLKEALDQMAADYDLRL